LIVISLDLILLSGLATAIFRIAKASDPTAFPQSHWMFAPFVALLTVGSLWGVGAYRTTARFVAPDQFPRTIVGTSIGGLLAFVLAQKLNHQFSGETWESAILFVTAASTVLVGLRGVAARFLRIPSQSESAAIRSVIYGAGRAGTQLAAALQTSSKFHLVAFVDDCADLHGRTQLGLRVLSPDTLPRLKAQGKFDQIFLAIPTLQGARRRQLLESLARLAVKVMVMPSLEELASGKQRIDQLNEVQVTDLLSRDHVEANRALLERNIKGRSVLVTGAAGSIGSELCRQALSCGAHKLVMFDHSEFGLYTIERELASCAKAAGCELIPVLGSVSDENLLRDSLARERVDSVYHAAAYKHVPLVEQNVLSAVSNNVFGTLNVARASLDCKVGNLVLISTDKAVRPTSVMGASKRICEMIVQALAETQGNTNMSMVRFGNVLGSSGSVIPLFQQQISSGGPVTVTHPEVTRYFMTINEAAQLVIQAGAMGRHGEVFVLDMGEPIKIVDLAERMIRLSGLELKSPQLPNGDISIEITGLRPGEKLHEELLIGEQQNSTIHPRIFKASEDSLPWNVLEARLHALQIAISNSSYDQVARMVHELAHEEWKSSPVDISAHSYEHSHALRLVVDNVN
jgi:FlaA1/EpsC-like NDP-sugar epimerase